MNFNNIFFPYVQILCSYRQQKLQKKFLIKIWGKKRSNGSSLDPRKLHVATVPLPLMQVDSTPTELRVWPLQGGAWSRR